MLYSNPELHIKRCSRCHEWQDYSEFPKNNQAKDGLNLHCKKCQSARRKPKTPYGSSERVKRMRSDGMFRCYKCRKYLPPESFHKNSNAKYSHGLSSTCKECVKTYQRSYYGGIGKRLTVNTNRLRSQRLKNVPNTITGEQWEFALNYFHGCCAVCGRQLRDLLGTHTVAVDHWHPLVKGGGTVATNLIPLCHGVSGCNNKKHDRLPDEWLIAEFGKRKAKKILKRIQDYFDTVLKRSM